MDKIVSLRLFSPHLKARIQKRAFGYEWDVYFFKTKATFFALSLGEPIFIYELYRSRCHGKFLTCFDERDVLPIINDFVERGIFEPQIA